MTLKLSTFLLPSNQFALIAEFDDYRLANQVHANRGLEEFARRCGAVDVLIVNYPTRVEDAILSVNYPAERADEEELAVEPDYEVHDESHTFSEDDWAETHAFFPSITGPNGQNFTVEFTTAGPGDLQRLLFGGAPGNDLVREHVEAGHDFSPAGLVKLTDEEKAEKAAALTGVSPAEWVDGVRAEQAELCAQAPYLADQVEQLPGSPVSPELLAEELVEDVLPWTPQPGETVVVAVEGPVYGPEHLDGQPLLGQELFVVGSPYVAESGPAEGDEVIWLDNDPAEDGQIVLRTADILPLSAV